MYARYPVHDAGKAQRIIVASPQFAGNRKAGGDCAVDVRKLIGLLGAVGPASAGKEADIFHELLFEIHADAAAALIHADGSDIRGTASDCRQQDSILEATHSGVNAATLVERMMRERPHPEQGYRSAMGIIALARRYERDRLEAACERALAINATSYLRERHPQIRAGPREPCRRTRQSHASHANIRGGAYYQ